MRNPDEVTHTPRIAKKRQKRTRRSLHLHLSASARTISVRTKMSYILQVFSWWLRASAYRVSRPLPGYPGGIRGIASLPGGPLCIKSESGGAKKKAPKVGRRLDTRREGDERS